LDKNTPFEKRVKNTKKHMKQMESLENRRQTWKSIRPILKKEYPSPKIGLKGWENPMELAISTILSAQCTDARVNIVTQKLFKKYKTPQDYLRVKPTELEKDIHSTGFYKNKTKNIRGFCEKLIREYNGKVPDTMEQLITMPGVGRKTANIVLANAFGKNEGIAVDTHVFRVTHRLGLTSGKNPVQSERELMQIVDKKEWAVFTDYIIWHGRKVCVAQKPRCSTCPVFKYCPRVGVERSA
jgi:endonuclease-3